jgi:hypothetical protein
VNVSNALAFDEKRALRGAHAETQRGIPIGRGDFVALIGGRQGIRARHGPIERACVGAKIHPRFELQVDVALPADEGIRQVHRVLPARHHETLLEGQRGAQSIRPHGKAIVQPELDEVGAADLGSRGGALLRVEVEG